MTDKVFTDRVTVSPTFDGESGIEYSCTSLKSVILSTYEDPRCVTKGVVDVDMAAVVTNEGSENQCFLEAL